MQYTSHTVLAAMVLTIQVTYFATAYRSDSDIDDAAWLEAMLDEPYTADNEAIPNVKDLDAKYDLDETGYDNVAPYEALPTDKRYARLSYAYGNYGRGGNRRYHFSRYYANYYKPWMNLPNTECFRKRCSSDRQCCRRFSKCDKSAHVCYNCWYGHPCKTSRDCCERYPYCNRQTKLCQV